VGSGRGVVNERGLQARRALNNQALNALSRQPQTPAASVLPPPSDLVFCAILSRAAHSPKRRLAAGSPPCLRPSVLIPTSSINFSSVCGGWLGGWVGGWVGVLQ